MVNTLTWFAEGRRKGNKELKLVQRTYTLKDVHLSGQTRRRLQMMRWIVKPLIRLFALLPKSFAATAQLGTAKGLKGSYAGISADYDVLAGVPGVVLGDLYCEDGAADTALADSTVVLYLHGGGFVMPAIPRAHVGFAARLCRELSAVGFMPDYRLAPQHKFPAGLDDCEKSYRGLLDRGYSAEKIVLAGESAGGALVLGLLQRIRKSGLPMPACAIPLSPVAEIARAHSPPSRMDNARSDVMLPVKAYSRMLLFYADGLDGSDPEMSPMLAEYHEFPPLLFLVSEAEFLFDDSLICAKQARRAGVSTRVDVWPALPHAFPLLAAVFPEAKQALADIVEFARQQLKQ